MAKRRPLSIPQYDSNIGIKTEGEREKYQLQQAGGNNNTAFILTPPMFRFPWSSLSPLVG